MSPRHGSPNTPRIVFGVLVATVGVLFLLDNLGVLYAYHLDRPDLARRFWHRYLKLAPEGPEAEAVREELRGLDASD